MKYQNLISKNKNIAYMIGIILLSTIAVASHYIGSGSLYKGAAGGGINPLPQLPGPPPSFTSPSVTCTGIKTGQLAPAADGSVKFNVTWTATPLSLGNYQYAIHWKDSAGTLDGNLQSPLSWSYTLKNNEPVKTITMDVAVINTTANLTVASSSCSLELKNNQAVPPPALSCSGTQNSQAPGPNSTIVTDVTWSATVGGIGNTYDLYWAGNPLLPGVYTSPQTVKYSLPKNFSTQKVLMSVKLMDKITKNVLANTSCDLDIKNNTPVANPGDILNGLNLPSVSCEANPSSVKVGEPVTWKAVLNNVPNPSNVNYSFSGDVVGDGKFAADGTSTKSVIYNSSGSKNANVSVKVLTKTFTGNCSALVSAASSGGDNSSGNSSSGSGNSGSGFSSTDFNTNTSSGNSQTSSSQAPNLKPAVELVSCKLFKKTFALDHPLKFYITCRLTGKAIVSAKIIKGAFDPSKDISSTDVVKNLLTNNAKNALPFTAGWDGKDQYDETPDAGDYTFYVSAQPDLLTNPDISALKFQIVDKEAETVAADTTSTLTDLLHGSSSQEQPVTPTPPAAPTPPPVEQTPPTPPATPSQCGIAYPQDIKGHWAEEAIKKAVDACAIKGVNGKFSPDQKATRFQVVKTGMLLMGIAPDLGCFNDSCGTPFLDINKDQAAWIRVAWKLKLIKGQSATSFGPDRPMTRGEFAIFMARLGGIGFHKDCYTPHCGAGYPTNIFFDVTDWEQGAYLRGMWDANQDLIHGTGPHTFEPYRAITRAEMVTALLKLKEWKQPMAEVAPPITPPATNVTGDSASTSTNPSSLETNTISH